MKRLCTLIFFIFFTSHLWAIDPNKDVVLNGSEKADQYQQIREATQEDVSFTPVVFIYVLLGAGVIWIGWRYFKNNGTLPGRDLKPNEITQLRVLGNKPLGNKQNLMVIEFEGRKMLLGVGPGFISYLTDSQSTASKAPPEFKIEEDFDPSQTES
jgi:flagellar biogenesis protein FliO